jgi:hypothetical protein
LHRSLFSACCWGELIDGIWVLGNGGPGPHILDARRKKRLIPSACGFWRPSPTVQNRLGYFFLKMETISLAGADKQERSSFLKKRTKKLLLL